MGKKLSKNERIDNIGMLQEYLRDYSNTGIMCVIAQRRSDTIFHGNVTVSISDCNIYFKVNIMWEDIEPDFHDFGLYGYYSSDYCHINYSKGVLTILSDDVVITVTK